MQGGQWALVGTREGRSQRVVQMLAEESTGNFLLCFIREAQSRSMANPRPIFRPLLLSTTPVLTPALRWSLRNLTCLSHGGISAQWVEAASKGRAEGGRPIWGMRLLNDVSDMQSSYSRKEQPSVVLFLFKPMSRAQKGIREASNSASLHLAF